MRLSSDWLWVPRHAWSALLWCCALRLSCPGTNHPFFKTLAQRRSPLTSYHNFSPLSVNAPALETTQKKISTLGKYPQQTTALKSCP